MSDELYRAKKLDAQGTKVEVLRDRSVRIRPPDTAPIRTGPIRFSAEEWEAATKFVLWCYRDLRKEDREEG